MEMEQIAMPLLGGVLIGLAASLLLLLKGRILGISGILAGVLLPKKGETAWRVASVAGLLGAGAIFLYFQPAALEGGELTSPLRYVVAGLLVGFGTQLGSGCTSGHGICGISRASPRSIVATLTFIVAGVAMVAALRAGGVIS